MATTSPTFFVYILPSQANGRYYIGVTQDVAKRVAQHNAGYTTATRGKAARQREAALKRKKSRRYLEWMDCPAVGAR